MADLTGKLVILPSSTFHDRYVLAKVVKETDKTITIQTWNMRASAWEPESRRNYKGITSIISDNCELVTPAHLNLLVQQMRSVEAMVNDRIIAAQQARLTGMRKIQLP